MSGGRWDYVQFRFDEIASDIEELAENETNETAANQFRTTASTLRKAAKQLQRVDWYVCADDGVESFIERWHEEGCD